MGHDSRNTADGGRRGSFRRGRATACTRHCGGATRGLPLAPRGIAQNAIFSVRRLKTSFSTTFRWRRVVPMSCVRSPCLLAASLRSAVTGWRSSATARIAWNRSPSESLGGLGADVVPRGAGLGAGFPAVDSPSQLRSAQRAGTPATLADVLTASAERGQFGVRQKGVEPQRRRVSGRGTRSTPPDVVGRRPAGTRRDFASARQGVPRHG